MIKVWLVAGLELYHKIILGLFQEFYQDLCILDYFVWFLILFKILNQKNWGINFWLIS